VKKSSIFVLKSFLGPFILTFFIALFILLMQFVWKYIDDMVGKGLEWYIIAELLFYTSASMVPLALPLAMLLSSLMTFGNLGENYELVAFRSAGISLQRIMKPLIYFIVMISIGAFLFSNYMLPVFNLKMSSLLYDVRHQKPAVNIKPGVFYNEIDGFTIKVTGKQSTEEGEILENVMIYDHTQRNGNRKVIVAEKGIMKSDPNQADLVIALFNGYSYDEQMDKQRQKKVFPLFRNSFDEDIIRMDVSEFEMNRTDEELFKTHYEMLNLTQLDVAIDSFYIKNEERKNSLATSMKGNYEILRDSTFGSVKHDSIFSLYTHLAQADKRKVQRVFQNASNITRGLKNRVNTTHIEIDNRNETIRKHFVEWHKKLTLSFACIVLFFIGAPLGAIIRKGGLGMPVVVSVLFFLVFHVLSITGEKLSESNVVYPAFGMWLASFVLLPVGIFLTYKATTDSAVLDFTSYSNYIKKLFSKKTNANAHSSAVS
jgi:lipopolysaccharide export system permease protein